MGTMIGHAQKSFDHAATRLLVQTSPIKPNVSAPWANNARSSVNCSGDRRRCAPGCGWWRSSRQPCGGGSQEKKGADRGDPRDHALGRSRGGFGTKVQLLSDGAGLPLAVLALPGQAHEATQFKAVLNSVCVPQCRVAHGLVHNGLPLTGHTATSGFGISCGSIALWPSFHPNNGGGDRKLVGPLATIPCTTWSECGRTLYWLAQRVSLRRHAL